MTGNKLRLAAGIAFFAVLAAAQPDAARQALAAATSLLRNDTTTEAAPFVLTDENGPVRWGCQEVSVVVNATLGGQGALDDAIDAIDLAAELSGVRFVYRGTTSAMPTANWYQTGNGSSYPPVLIAWSTPELSDVFATDSETAAAMANPAGAGKDRRIVTGVVAVNAERSATLRPGLAAGRTRGAIIVHELLHVAGLGHSAQADQLMSAQVTDSAPLALSADEAARVEILRPRCR
jgi:hypothetical protein